MSAGIAGVLGAVTGAALLLVPEKLLGGPSPVRRLLFETNLGEPFNRRFAIERGIYRRHRIFGSAVIAGGLAVVGLATYLTVHPKALNIYLLLGKSSFRVTQFITATIGVMLVTVGVCLVVRPSVLKGIEAAANQWVEPLPRRAPHVATAVLRAPRIAGVLLLLLSTYGLSLL